MKHLVGSKGAARTRRYFLAQRSDALSTSIDEAISKALSTPGVRATVTNRLPWGLVVRASPNFAKLIRNEYPGLEINEETLLNVV